MLFIVKWAKIKPYIFSWDSLTIYDGGSNTSPMLGNPYCGDSLPPSQISSSNQLFFHFHSDGIGKEVQIVYRVFYMSFDRFLLAVESRDLSQADKRIIRVSSFSILQNFNFWMIKFTVITKKTTWHLAIWQNWCFGQFYLQDWKVNTFLSFSGER